MWEFSCVYNPDMNIKHFLSALSVIFSEIETVRKRLRDRIRYYTIPMLDNNESSVFCLSFKWNWKFLFSKLRNNEKMSQEESLSLSASAKMKIMWQRTKKTDTLSGDCDNWNLQILGWNQYWHSEIIVWLLSEHI